MSAAEPTQGANSAPSGGCEAAEPRARGGHTSAIDPPSSGTFAPDGNAWRFEGALTFDDAAPVFATSAAVALPAEGIDFSGMTRADSSALAVVIALRRRAAAEGRTLPLRNLPPSLRSLAVVYGVEELIA
ncbi:MAG TPA: STAS domain-containing protein [Casimicrobiaceae bacterium]|jgi:phospholipid transport system transporter-binding protein|nr:STAS domain-containing protein [Casimicrobiaceae bacterium]